MSQDAPPPKSAPLILQVRTLLQYSPTEWHARAWGCSHFAQGSNPLEAIQRAVALRDEKNPLT